ncbi:MAG TPA: hypothetical protein VFC07_11305 [Verrucomicrobiae bacterium]|nr:hypothetical protein [Verrucomicrobiae bacterium]
MNWIWPVSLILWAMIFVLCLVMLALMRRVGELANHMDGVKESDDINGSEGSSETVPLVNPGKANNAQELEAVEIFAPFTKLPEHTLPLLNGGAFQSGRKHTMPQLIVFFSPKSIACGHLLAAIPEFVKSHPPSEFALLGVLDIGRSAAEKYVAEKGLGSIAIAILEDVPESLRPGEAPFAIAITAAGIIAARGKPKNLSHLAEMAVAARHMADMCPSHSRRAHEWGESAPYWTPAQHCYQERPNGNSAPY